MARIFIPVPDELGVGEQWPWETMVPYPLGARVCLPGHFPYQPGAEPLASDGPPSGNAQLLGRCKLASNPSSNSASSEDTTRNSP